MSIFGQDAVAVIDDDAVADAIVTYIGSAVSLVIPDAPQISGGQVDDRIAAAVILPIAIPLGTPLVDSDNGTAAGGHDVHIIGCGDIEPIMTIVKAL